MHIQIAQRRICPKCTAFTDQICHKIRYQKNDDEVGTLLKKSYWICPTCLTETEEVRIQPLPGDKIRIINRVLKMREDYSIHSMSISSQPEKLVIEMTVKE